MNPIQVSFKRLDRRASSPRQAHAGDAGFDLAALDDVRLAPGERCAARTGLAVAIPPGHAGWVVPRSGHAARDGLSVVNAPGLVDAGFRGEVKVLLINHGSKPVTYRAGERIAQLVVVAVPPVELTESDELDDTERGAGGFGSSGR